MGKKLLLASLTAAWLVAIAGAFLWLGLWVAATHGPDGAIGYWCFAWALFGAIAAAPFVVYSEAGR